MMRAPADSKYSSKPAAMNNKIRSMLILNALFTIKRELPNQYSSKKDNGN